MRRAFAVLAGGLGTRVAHLTDAETPKAMLPVGGRPFIDVKLAELVAAGADDIVVLVGHGGDALRRHVGDAAAGGVPVHFVDDGPELLGTGGAIGRALSLLPDPFWVTYGDTLLAVDVAPVETRLTRSPEAHGVMTVLRNADRWERSNVSVDDDWFVTSYDKSSPPGTHEYIDYGMLLLRHGLFDRREAGSAFDLGNVLRNAVAARRILASAVPHRFHDIGTEQAWRETDEWASETSLWDHLLERIGDRATHRELP